MNTYQDYRWIVLDRKLFFMTRWGGGGWMCCDETNSVWRFWGAIKFDHGQS